MAKRLGARGALKKAWKAKFLKALALGGTITESARCANVGRTSVYRELEDDEAFATNFKDAEKQSADLLEAEARRRATVGVAEPVIYKGELMGVWLNEAGETVAPGTVGAKLHPLTINRPSDTLIIFLLKGRRPEVFGDRLNLTGDLTTRSVELDVVGVTPKD